MFEEGDVFYNGNIKKVFWKIWSE